MGTVLKIVIHKAHMKRVMFNLQNIVKLPSRNKSDFDLKFGGTTIDVRKSDEAWQKLSVKLTKKEVDCLDHIDDEGNFKEKPENSVRIVMISDTHDHHHMIDDIPEGDIIIHAGDFTQNGTPEAVINFSRWFGSLPHKHKVVIAGNHDITLDEDFYLEEGHRWHGKNLKDHKSALAAMRDNPGFIYLENSTVEILGLKIYGSPYSAFFHNWAFNSHRGPESAEIWSQIPDDTDIIVAHGPALGYGDRVISPYFPGHQGTHCGCANLLHEIKYRIKPKLMISGHIHEDPGAWTDGVTTFVNASTCDLKYKPVNPICVIDLNK